jgi:hypothetical protein
MRVDGRPTDSSPGCSVRTLSSPANLRHLGHGKARNHSRKSPVGRTFFATGISRTNRSCIDFGGQPKSVGGLGVGRSLVDEPLRLCQRGLREAAGPFDGPRERDAVRDAQLVEDVAQVCLDRLLAEE